MEGNIDSVGSISIVPTNVATPTPSNEGIESIDPSIASEKDKEDKTSVDKITSEVWNDFNRVVNWGKTVTASCKHYGRIFNGLSAMGTSYLNTHRKTCSKRTHKDVGQLLLSMSKSSNESTPKLANFKFDPVTTQKDFARLIAKHSLPFNMVELSNKKRVSLDVPTRWNSTYEMLHNSVEVRDAYKRLDKCKKIEQCLKVFYDATKHVSGTKYPTANFYFKDVCDYTLQMIYGDDCEYYVRKIKNDVVDLFSEYASKYSNFGGISKNDKSIFGNKRFFKFIQERTGGVRSHQKTELDMILLE
ncbi:hypothetical protein NE237_011977 [Protea cynaroides]|uniref:Uncharacterized protein n=1 Tax=Protea cynaroides TaxID=273540 RepID=A0A9Q0H0Z6_9MAGN|nr:hypothetical protein NE237_011977 [Protea cynaroides]